MPLDLIVSAGYQKAGSILKVSVNGTYGWMLARPTNASLSITLIRLEKFTSSGPVTVTVPIETNLPIGIESNGSITQDGTPSPPLVISKRIATKSFIKARVIVDVYRAGKLIASEIAIVK